MTFTSAQREQVETMGTLPIEIDGISCMVLRADIFEKWKEFLFGGYSHDELRELLARSAQGSDWLDPAMDIYDEYDKHR